MTWSNQTWQVMLKDLRSIPMTLEAIGTRVGVGRSFICRMLKGESRPSLTTYQEIEKLHRSRCRAIKRARGKV